MHMLCSVSISLPWQLSCSYNSIHCKDMGSSCWMMILFKSWLWMLFHNDKECWMVNFDGVLTTVSLTMVTLPQPYLSIRNGYKQVLPSLLSLLVFSTRPKIKQTKMSMLQQHVISSHHQHSVQSSHEFVKRLVNASRLLCIHTYTSYQWCKYTIAMQNCYKS